MDPTIESPTPHLSEPRAHASSAAIAAGLMLYFGYVQFAIPTATGLFEWCNLVLVYTLRIGGVAMAAVAVALFVGLRSALVADGLVSIVSGGVFILTGVGMILGGGVVLQTLINVAVGYMFIRAGIASAAAFFRDTQPRHDHDSRFPIE